MKNLRAGIRLLKRALKLKGPLRHTANGAKALKFIKVAFGAFSIVIGVADVAVMIFSISEGRHHRQQLQE